MCKNHRYSVEIQIANATKLTKLLMKNRFWLLMTKQYQMVKRRVSEVNYFIKTKTDFFFMTAV